MVKCIRFAVLTVLVGTAGTAHAQVDNAGVLDQALRRFREAAQGWQDASHSAATSLFWSLATISLVWTIGQLALRRAELGEFFSELVRYLLFTGFWAWMLQNGPTHAQMIMDSMVRIGGSAAGTTLQSPSGVLDVGFRLLDRALEQSSIQSPVETSIGVVMALGILIVLALVGVNMLVTMISCWIVAYGGLIVLGFGGSKWTSDMANNYYRMILSLGLQVLAMVLLVGVGEGLLRDYFGRLEETVNVRELAVMLVIAIVLLLTVNRVPALLGTLANGSSPQYALGSGAGAGAALSTLSATSAMAAMASRPVMDGAQQLARAAAAGFATGGAGAAASLADSFRSGGSQDAASSGSVFAPAPTAAAPATTEAGRSSFGSLAGSGDANASASSERRPGSLHSAGTPDDAGAEGQSVASADHEQAADGKPTMRTTHAAAEKDPWANNEPSSHGPTNAGGHEAAGSANDAQRSEVGRPGSNAPAARAPLPSSAAASASEAGAHDTSGSTTAPSSMQTGRAPSHSAGVEGPLVGTAGAAVGTARASGTGAATGDATSQSTGPALSATSITPAPNGSIASATQMQIQVQPHSDDRFQNVGAPPPPLGAFQSSRREAAAPPPSGTAAGTRNELVAASLTQTSLDIEAEVAAFRDREE